MLSKYLFLLLLFVGPIQIPAQHSNPARIFGKAQVDIQAAIGIFPTYIADKPEPIVPPLQLSARWMASDLLSLNASAGYSSCRSRETLTLDSARGRWYNQTWFLSIENGFHYTKIEEWDFYGGLSLLYQHIRLGADSPEFRMAMRQSGAKPRQGRVSLTAYIGCRFALSPHYSIFTELGYGLSLFKIGMGYKL